MRPLARLPLAALALAGAGCGGGDDPVQRRPAPERVVGCGDVILKPRSATADGYRVLLGGAVSVPPAHLSQTAATGDPEWPFWEKAGLVVRAGRGPLDVSVPAAWRDRAAITWGNGGGPVSSLRIAACPDRGWNAYAGGLFIKRRSGCVPLVLRAGDRTATVTIGLEERDCPQP
jgi:hypothetical protein